jgi:hypothetical protein
MKYLLFIRRNGGNGFAGFLSIPYASKSARNRAMGQYRRLGRTFANEPFFDLN